MRLFDDYEVTKRYMKYRDSCIARAIRYRDSAQVWLHMTRVRSDIEVSKAVYMARQNKTKLSLVRQLEMEYKALAKRIKRLSHLYFLASCAAHYHTAQIPDHAVATIARVNVLHVVAVETLNETRCHPGVAKHSITDSDHVTSTHGPEEVPAPGVVYSARDEIGPATLLLKLLEERNQVPQRLVRVAWIEHNHLLGGIWYRWHYRHR